MKHSKTCESKKTETPALWKLILICTTASFFALLPANGVSIIASYFNISPNLAAGVLSWFLLGYGVGPLIYAPLANRLGRKRALMVGFSVALAACLGSIIAAWLHSLSLLLITRFIAGIGTSAGLVIGMLMISDTADEKESRKIFAMIVLFFSFAPSIAIACGSIMTKYLGLQPLFIIMSAIMLLWIFLVTSLEETMQGQHKKINIADTMRSYNKLLIQRKFILPALLMTIASSLMYVFNGLSPLIAISQLHLSVVTYGNLAIIPSLGLFIGAILSSRLSSHLDAKSCMLIGLAISSLGAISLYACFLLHALNVWTLLFNAMLLFMGAAIIIPNASMSAISSASDAAAASSVLNSQTLILSSLAVSASSLLLPHGSLMFASIFIILCLIAWPLLIIINKATNKTVQPITKTAIEEILV